MKPELKKLIHSSDIEIMAPVGSYESLAAAINAGAGSVYFGVEGLNMRSASSVNFTLDDLRKIVELASAASVKTYLTVNTVLYDTDMEYMEKVLDAAAESGISAVIVSDQAAMIAARKRGIPVHLSTQLNISNVESLRFYSQWADVVVLARELELHQVKHIWNTIQKENICGPSGNPIRIEMFVHGALCMAVSGKCYLSLHEAWKSANRGECRQICRRSYTVTDDETGAQLKVDNKRIMSPKDLCTIEFLDRMIESGVRVMKIEGRARGAEYVSRTVHAYRNAADSIISGQWSEELAGQLKSTLEDVFNRGFWGGYYLGHPLGEWSDSYGSAARRRKVYAGRVTNFFSNISVAEVLLEGEALSSDDNILIIGQTTGVVEQKVGILRLDGPQEYSHVEKGSLAAFKTNEAVRRGDKVYIFNLR